jgi:hypothetical protein
MLLMYQKATKQEGLKRITTEARIKYLHISMAKKYFN